MNNPPYISSISPLIPAGDDLEKAMEFYEQKLGFVTIHKEGNPLRMAIVKRDNAEIFLVKSDYHDLAKEISLRLKVTGIEQLYQELESKHREIIQPNGKLETKPWGPKEFTVIDLAGVCLTFYEFTQ
ncbi:bleomycin resistance family protein [[Phormidium ambiguum] IAM M-71]|uniref:Bleomycin resistance protein n=1 Tax=[Phormidium ambiguum] IAM M-71 TaxID=454136 RepID=A0A1U7IIT9_9CYAN|nr:glyoxalase superfamily protein [Phormidium ambiguum]OKH37041.1 bleomycin resistance family protein [Phormidium ambiguum IAM M-71]